MKKIVLLSIACCFAYTYVCAFNRVAKNKIRTNYICYNDTVQDTISTNDTLPVVSSDNVKAIANDTTAVVADSVSQNESAVVDTAYILNPYAQLAREARKHFVKKPLSKEEYMACYKFYKEYLEAGDMYKAYQPWKDLFNHSEERNISLFNEGVPVIMGCLIADTVKKEYSNIERYREELVELYEIAIENVDALNNQLDFSRGGKPITVAELRSQQLSYYDNLLIMDSVFHRNHHKNYYNKEDTEFWKKKILEDSTEVYKHYAWLRDIVHSTDKVKINQLVDYSVVLNSKLNSDIKRLNLNDNIPLGEFLASYANKEKDHCSAKMEELHDDVNYAPYKAEMISNFAASEGVVTKDAKRLIQINRDAIEANGWTQQIIDKILKSKQIKEADDPLYLEALRQKYSIDPSYHMAREIVNFSIQKNSDVVYEYLNAMELYDEYSEQPEEEKVNLLISVARFSYNKKRPSRGYEYCQKAMKINANAPEIYVVIGDYVQNIMRQSYKANMNGQETYTYHLYCCAAIYNYEKALTLNKKLDSSSKLFLKNENSIKNIISREKENLRTEAFLFMKNIKPHTRGTVLSFKNIGSYTVIFGE